MHTHTDTHYVRTYLIKDYIIIIIMEFLGCFFFGRILYAYRKFCVRGISSCENNLAMFLIHVVHYVQYHKSYSNFSGYPQYRGKRSLLGFVYSLLSLSY